MHLSTETYISLFNSLPRYAFILDSSASIIEVNTRVRNSSIHAKNLVECLDDEGKKLFQEALTKDWMMFRSEFYFNQHDHTYSEVSVNKIGDPENALYLVLVKDITELHDKELDLLRFSEVIYRTVNPIQITNAKGEIIYANPAYIKISGYSKEELIGKNPRILNSGKHGKEFWRKVWSKILSGEQWVGQVQNRRKDGKLFYSELVISPIIAEDKKVIGFLGAHRDITEQKILEQQLVRSQKMETFGTLAAGIAHEVGNPLTSISSLVQILQRSTNDEFFKDKLELVKNQINRITKIIRELVDFSRPSPHIEQDVNVNSVVKEALNIVQYGKKVRNIKFEIQLQNDLPQVSVVSDQLVQVFLNILMNAVDACEGRQCTISVSTRLKSDFVDVIMEDTGTGIAEDQLSKIFDPFFTTKEASKGTGLGLWVSLGIIKNFGGDIHVESELGTGTKFIVSLPMKGARNV